MLVELSSAWIVALNVTLWPAIQLGLAWGFTRMPAEWFDPPETWRFPGETVMRYEQTLRIRFWKDRLPDGASWFSGGVPKSVMKRRDVAGLARFAAETWRGELCHWSAFACLPLFFLWNPPWACGVIAGYVCVANLPCIWVQRYNRLRLNLVLKGKLETSRAST